MSQLQNARDTKEAIGGQIQLVVKAETTIHAGALVAIDATGYAVPAANAANLKVIGRAEHSAGALDPILVKRGVFLYDNDTVSAVAAANIGSYCYVKDDQTVQAAANSNAIAAGVVRFVLPEGIGVDTTVNPDGATAGAAAGATAGAAAVAAELEAGGDIALAIAAGVAAAGNVRLVAVPAAANSTGVKGDLAIDATSVYLCTATDTWVKAALGFATWGE